MHRPHKLLPALAILWLLPKADYSRSAWKRSPHCHCKYNFLMTLSSSSQSEPQRDILVPSASSAQPLISLGCSHLLQHLSPGPTASPCALLVPHSTYAWCGSAAAHQQLDSGTLRTSRLSLLPFTDTAHTLCVEKPSLLFCFVSYKWISKCSGIHQRELLETFTLIMLLSKLVTNLIL